MWILRVSRQYYVSGGFSLINDVIEMCSSMFLHVPDCTISLQVSHDIMFFIIWTCTLFRPVWLGWHEKEMSIMLLINEKSLKLISTKKTMLVFLFCGCFFSAIVSNNPGRYRLRTFFFFFARLWESPFQWPNQYKSGHVLLSRKY